jgi:tetratricopeptide (TPR) repeat protein
MWRGGPSPTDKLADTLHNAVNNSNQLVTMSSHDAYSYYMQLKNIDPTNKALTEIAPQVLPRLRSMGDDVFRRKVMTNIEKLTDQDWERTQRVYEWAYYLTPGDRQTEARWKFAFAEVAKAQKRLDEAERGFSAAAQLDSSWALPQNSLGLLRSEGKRWAEAVPHYQRAINLQPGWVIPYNNMGTAHFWQKDYETAAYWYNKAININPDWSRPHYWMGRIYEQKGMKSLAITEYQTALNNDPNGYSLTSDEQVFIRKRLEKLQGY